MRTVNVTNEVYFQFKHFCNHKGLQIKAAVEELMKCALTGSASGSFMEPFLMRKNEGKEQNEHTEKS